MKRPLLIAALGFTLGLYLFSQAQLRGLTPAAFAVLLAATLLTVILRRRHPLAQPVLIVLIAALAAGSVWHSREQAAQGDPLYWAALEEGRGQFQLEAEVLSADVHVPQTDYLRFTAAAKARAPKAWEDVGGKVLVRWSDPAFILYPGDRLLIEGRLDPSFGTVNFGISGQEESWRRRGVHSVLRVRGDGVERIGSTGLSIRRWIGRFRQWEANQLARIVPEGALPFVLTVWLGERSPFTEPTHEAYIASGTAHILAVSGVHMAIVFATVSQFLRLFVQRRRTRTALVMFTIVLFAFLAGARLPSLRAATMFAIYCIAGLLDREPDAPTALSIAALLLLLITPDLIYDAGFLLSFASVASLLLFSDPIAERLAPLPHAARNMLAPTLAVQILPLPLALHFFHVMPAFAPLANLIVIPLLTLVLWLCLAAVSVSAFSLGGGFLLGHAAYPFIESIRGVASFVAGLPLSHFRTVSPSWFAAVLLWTAAGLLLWSLYAPARRRVLAALCCLALAWVFWRDGRPAASIDFLDVGHGDAALVRTASGTTMLIDGGDADEYSDMGEWVLERFLYAHQFDSLDYVVVSHPDGDHIGGLFHILERFPVGAVLMSAAESERPAEQAFLELCRRRGVPVRRLGRGDTLRLDGDGSSLEGRLEVLHPPRGFRSESVNDSSLAFRLHWQGREVLFTGDIEASAEQKIVPLEPRADVLKVPHHGSHTSSTPAFLEAVRPAAAFVSTRASGREAIAKTVRAEYARQRIPLWRTDVSGGIRLRVERGVVEITTAREAKGLPPGAWDW